MIVRSYLQAGIVCKDLLIFSMIGAYKKNSKQTPAKLQFTNRKKTCLGRVFLKEVQVEYSKEIECVGIILAQRLNWNKQIDAITYKVTIGHVRDFLKKLEDCSLG